MSSNSSVRLFVQALVIMAATSLGVVVGVTLTRSDNSTEAGVNDLKSYNIHYMVFG